VQSRRGLQKGTVSVDGQERTYLLEPAYAVAAGVPAPLVFVWHGLGGSGSRAYERFGMSEAVAGRAVVVFPDALASGFGGKYGWDLRRNGTDVAFFDHLLEKVARTSCIDLGRVFSTGHSFGGWMTNRIGFLRGSRLRGIAPGAGGLSPGDCGARPLATMIIHATNDPTVSFQDGAAAEHMWSTAAGCRATTNPVPGAWPCVAHDGCAPRAPVLLCAHREYHSWPPFAAPAIWAFFDGLR
jgi:poly(3-hydroxybutyrate) depolymerase